MGVNGTASGPGTRAETVARSRRPVEPTMSEPDDVEEKEARSNASMGPSIAHHDWYGSDPLSTTIIEAVAAVDGHQPMEMEPLYDVIDTDALENLFIPGFNDFPQTSGHVSFHYNGAVVTVQTSGEIVVEPLE